ncbi:Z1 domain-containing protein [Gammaproteobacteria bacterium]|nr:Z1 domain-containing protein [Gammaproteobacteria bacterium]
MNKQKSTEASLAKEYYDQNFPNDNGFSLWADQLVIGEHFQTAIQNAKIPHKKSMEIQVATALEVLSCCNPVFEQTNIKRTGNVTGMVQSGKTTSFALLAAAAADNGYQLIINTLGTKNNLLDDNLISVKKILGCIDESESSWVVVPIRAKGRGGIGLGSEEIAGLLKQNPASRNKRRSPVYMPLLKNTDSINPLINLIRELRLNTEDIRVLIIDDEVDSYGINNKKYETGVSPTNKALCELRDVCGIATYVGYTATSAAVQLSHENNFMSPDFHALLHPGEGYIGNKDIFGEPPQIKNEEAYKNFKFNPQVVPLDIEKTIIDDKGKEKIVDDKTSLINTMLDAVCDFLVTIQVFQNRFPDNSEVKTMMIHPSARTGEKGEKPFELNHEECMDLLNDFLEDVLWPDLDSDNVDNINYQRLKRSYDHHQKNHTQEKDKFPTFSEVLDWIKAMVDPEIRTKSGKIYAIQACNMKSPPEIKWHAPKDKIWFLVGGAKLSRGFVVKGLLTTWMPVEPDKIVSDTMEQRGRFFGYKSKYADLIRVYVKKKTADAFLNYIIHEREQWHQFEQTRKLGKRLSECDVFHTSIDSIDSLTAKNKIKRTVKRIKYKWTAAKTLPFETLQGVLSKNVTYDRLISSYLDAVSLRQIDVNNKFNATSEGQKFACGNFAIEDVYKSLLQFLISSEIGLTPEDDYFKATIEYIKTHLLKDKKNTCDIVFFNGEGLSRQIQFDEQRGIWAWPSYGYTSGASKRLSLLDRGTDYCGDDQVILGNNFDPYESVFDKANNFNTTIQIHKLNVHADDGLHELQDIFGIRIRLPH